MQNTLPGSSGTDHMTDYVHVPGSECELYTRCKTCLVLAVSSVLDLQGQLKLVLFYSASIIYYL